MIKQIDTTYEELKNNIDYYVDLFLDYGILAFKQIHLSEAQQKKIMCLFGDRLNWLPNSQYIKGHRYVEDHTNALSIRDLKSKNDIIVVWHLEHCSVKHSQTGASWNMMEFKCDYDSGQTGFIDSSRIYDDMPEKWKQFINNCTIFDAMEGTLAEEFDETHEFVSLDGYRYKSFARNAVMIHPQNNKKILRINPIDVYEQLISVNGEKPSKKDQKMLDEIVSFYRNEINNNLNRQLWWKWSEGDLLIPDLRLMIHAVKGGFQYNERKFIGHWAYEFGAQESFPDLFLDIDIDHNPDFIDN